MCLYIHPLYTYIQTSYVYVFGNKASPWVHKHDMGCSSQVEGHPPGLQAHQEYPNIRVMSELLNHAVPVVHSHAALQPYALDSSLHHQC